MASVIVCGIPKHTSGKYYCPYCSFESDDIDQFAVGMCWNCMYDETEDITMASKFKEGQEVVVKETTGKLTVVADGLYEVTTSSGAKVITGEGRLRSPRPSWWPLQIGDQLYANGYWWGYAEVETSPGHKSKRVVKLDSTKLYVARSPKAFIEEYPNATLTSRNGKYV